MKKVFSTLKELRARNATIYQFFKFAIAGTIGAVVDFSVLFFLHRVFSLPEWSANLISTFVAICVLFVINKFWTFRRVTMEEWKVQSTKFFIVSSFNYVLQNLLFNAFLVYLPLNDYFGDRDYLFAKALAIGILMFSNFFGNKYWTFQEKSSTMKS